MPFFFIFLGLALIITAVRNQEQKLFRVLRSDFTSNNNVSAFLGAILILYMVGAIWKQSRIVIEPFLALVFVALLVSNQGFWQRFREQIA